MKLTEATYYSPEMNRKYYSASQIKTFRKCEAQALAEIKGEYERPMTQALTMGQYVDEALTGDLNAWMLQHPEICKKDGTLKAEYVQAQEMVDRAKRDPVFMSYMDGEPQKIVTGKLFGEYLFKAKFDVFHKDKIVDLKTVRDMEPVYIPGQGKVDFATAWDWPLQMAIYQAIYAARYHKWLPVYLAVITKESPADIAIIKIEQDRLDAELDWLKQAMPRIDAIKQGIIEPERCEHCAFCRESKVLTGAVSLSDYEEEALL